MALATQCPHCHTTFRVASDQLKLRGGIVRCGACQSIFDGNAHLIDLDALAASKARQAAPAPAEAPMAAASVPVDAPVDAPQAGAQAEPPADDAPAAGTPPVYTLDFDHTFDPLGILPKPAAEEAPAMPRAQVWRNGGGVPSAPDQYAAPPQTVDAPAEPAPAGGVPAAMAPAFEADTAPDADTDTAPQDADADAQAEAPVPEAEVPVPDVPPEAGHEHEHEPEPDAEAEADTDTDIDTSAMVTEPASADGAAGPDAAGPASAPASAPPPASAYAAEGRLEPRFEEPIAQPLPGDALAYHGAPPAAMGTGAGTDDIPLPLRASAAGQDTLAPPMPAPAPKSARAKAVEARSRRSRLTPTRIDAPKLRVPVSAEADEPEFVKRSRKQEQSGRTRRLLMIAGAVVLALLLAAQLLLGFRNVLAARYPGARPVLNAGCAVLGCRIGLPMQIENLAIETGELSTLGVDTYSLNTLLRNQASLVQAWPSIQLELTDANDKPLLRRVFGPAEYLPQGVSAAAGFAARSEQPVRLNFVLSGLKPSGYHMIIFYQDHP